MNYFIKKRDSAKNDCKIQFDKLELIKDKYKVELKTFKMFRDDREKQVNIREESTKLICARYTTKKTIGENKIIRKLANSKIKELLSKMNKQSKVLENMRIDISDEENSLSKLEDILNMYERDVFTYCK